jgi:hypothetical protein
MYFHWSTYLIWNDNNYRLTSNSHLYIVPIRDERVDGLEYAGKVSMYGNDILPWWCSERVDEYGEQFNTDSIEWYAAESIVWHRITMMICMELKKRSRKSLPMSHCTSMHEKEDSTMNNMLKDTMNTWWETKERQKARSASVVYVLRMDRTDSHWNRHAVFHYNTMAYWRSSTMKTNSSPWMNREDVSNKLSTTIYFNNL